MARRKSLGSRATGSAEVVRHTSGQRRGSHRSSRQQQPARTIARAAQRAIVESLEHRQLLASVTLSDGTLTLRGDNGSANTLFVDVLGSNLIANANAITRTLDPSSVERIRIYGGDDDDRIAVRSTLDKPMYATGGSGDDSIYGGKGRDSLYGNSGDDVIHGNGDNDRLISESGRDSLYGGPQADTIISQGIDEDQWSSPIVDGIRTAPSSDSTSEGSSSETGSDSGSGSGHGGGAMLSGIGGSARNDAEPAADSPAAAPSGTFRLKNRVLTLTGATRAPNTITVTLSGKSTLVATVNGASKSFSASSVSRLWIDGGDKGDIIAIAPAVTTTSLINGAAGNDTLHGGGGRDEIWGKKGHDLAYGNGGNDTVYGLSGNDTIWGGPGSDKLYGGRDRNKVEAGGAIVAGPIGSSTPGGVPVNSGDDDDDDDKTKPADTGENTKPANTGDNAKPADTGEKNEPDDDGGPTHVAAPVPVITATTSRTFEAGHAFHAQGLSSKLKVGTALTARYHWDFGDPDGRFNTLDGWNVAHHYERPGTYTVRLTVTNAGGRSATTTTTLTVKESTRRKVYVSTDGSDSNDGSSPSRAIRTVAKAQSLTRDNTEILFRRGDTFAQYTSLRPWKNNVVIGAYGSGPRPVLMYKGRFDHSALISVDRGRDITIRDLTFDSAYDIYRLEPDGAPRGVVVGGKTNATVLNCLFYNLGYGISTAKQPTALLVQDNAAPVADTIRSYFAWVEGTDHVYLGNQSANVKGHTLRIGGATRVNITGNDFTNPPDSNGTIRGTLTLHTGEYLYVANNKLNKSKVTLGPLSAREQRDQRYKWIVFEGNDLTSALKLEDGIDEVMIRNNVFRVHDTYAIEVSKYHTGHQRGVEDVTIVNNTSVNTSEDGNFLKLIGTASGMTVANNLFHAPNLETGYKGNSPVRVMDQTRSLRSFKLFANNVWGDPVKKRPARGGINFIAPEYPDSVGYFTAAKWNALPQVSTDYFVNTKLGSGYAPDDDSVAASAAARFAGVFTDKNGKPRPTSGPWSAGAIEV